MSSLLQPGEWVNVKVKFMPSEEVGCTVIHFQQLELNF